MSILSSFRKIIIAISPSLPETIGKFYGKLIPFLPAKTVSISKMIGKYGPFKLHLRFLMRDFSDWGTEHNGGFESCIVTCKGKECVLDIGAHIGLVSMPISQFVDPEGKIYAFEPATINRFYLTENIRFSKLTNIEVIDYLVGDSCKDDVQFYEQNIDTGLNSVVIKKNPLKNRSLLMPSVMIKAFHRN